MIDQPGKLIAMRLTEYYEIKASGIISPNPGVHATRPINNGVARETQTIAHTPVLDDDDEMTNVPFNDYNDDQPASRYIESETPVATSPDVAHNAEAAADYWTIL